MAKDQTRQGKRRKFEGQIDDVWQQLDVAYDFLLSGKAEHIRAVRPLIDAHLEASPLWLTLDVVDRIKQWINQEDDDTKHIKWLDDTYAVANPVGDNIPDDKDSRWLWKGRTARALFYAGRFKRARKRFWRSRKRVKENFTGVVNSSNLVHAYDIRAAEGEFEVYMGYPSNAIARLHEIPQASRLAWHEWVRAFAFHQRGFIQRVDFGTHPGRDAPTMPGPPPPRNESWYVQSNRILENLRALPDDELSPAEKYDSWLLTAANFGALARLGDASARTEAGRALAQFMRAPSPSKNGTWSWKKEQRGRFPIRAFPGERPSEDVVTAWRDAYQGHYRDNLVEAGLELTWRADPADDGDLGNDDDSAVDDDDNIE